MIKAASASYPSLRLTSVADAGSRINDDWLAASYSPTCSEPSASVTICLPADGNRVVHSYDKDARKWTALELMIPEHDEHVCGDQRHDLDYLAVARLR